MRDIDGDDSVIATGIAACVCSALGYSHFHLLQRSKSVGSLKSVPCSFMPAWDRCIRAPNSSHVTVTLDRRQELRTIKGGFSLY